MIESRYIESRFDEMYSDNCKKKGMAHGRVCWAKTGNEDAERRLYDRRKRVCAGLWQAQGGKSELILQFIKDKPALCFVGTQSAVPLQIRDFLHVAAKRLDSPFLASLAPPDWETAIETVWAQWHGPGKLILVFDEFQWAVRSAPELPSVLQQLWDLVWSRTGNAVLILCGSFVGFMEREVLGKESPLFGRRTAQILLKPFSFGEAALFHPRYSVIDKAQTYAVCGGVPLYLKFFKPVPD